MNNGSFFTFPVLLCMLAFAALGLTVSGNFSLINYIAAVTVGGSVGAVIGVNAIRLVGTPIIRMRRGHNAMRKFWEEASPNRMSWRFTLRDVDGLKYVPPKNPSGVRFLDQPPPDNVPFKQDLAAVACCMVGIGIGITGSYCGIAALEGIDKSRAKVPIAKLSQSDFIRQYTARERS